MSIIKDLIFSLILTAIDFVDFCEALDLGSSLIKLVFNYLADFADCGLDTALI